MMAVLKAGFNPQKFYFFLFPQFMYCNDPHTNAENKNIA